MENQTNLTAVKKRFGVIQYKENPFLDPHKIKTKEKRITSKKENMAIVRAGDGVVVAETAGFWASKKVDSEQFVKIFLDGVKQLADLTNAGTKVLALLLEEVQTQIGKDQVFLVHQKVEEKIGRTTFSRGINELVSKDFIAGSYQGAGWWFINPNFIFNGDRLVIITEYEKDNSKKKTIKERVAEQIEHKDNMAAEAEEMKNGG